MLSRCYEDRGVTACNDNRRSPGHRIDLFRRDIVALALATKGSMLLTYLADGVFVISQGPVVHHVPVLTKDHH